MQYYIPILLEYARYYAKYESTNYKVTPDEYSCPLCGRIIVKNTWAPPYRVQLSNNKFGDLVFGSDLLASQKFKDAFEAEGLTGITFETLDRVTVRNNRDQLVPPVYYYAKIRRIPATFDPEKTMYTTRGGGRDLYCPECFPLKNYDGLIDDMDGFELKFKEGEKVPDVFKTYVLWCYPFFSQRVVDLAKKYQLTNVLNKLIPTQQFKRFSFYPAERSKNFEYEEALVARRRKKKEEY